MEAYHRLESLEYYATVLMYTGNIIGKANVLNCNQVSQLLQIREQLGINSGGIPQCSVAETNIKGIEAASVTAPVKVMPAEEEDREAIIRTIIERVTKTVLQNYRR